MAELTPNLPPPGATCGTCRFAGTHTHATPPANTLIRCLRYPPQRQGNPDAHANVSLERQKIDTIWPVLTWDDWCGEWAARLPDREAVLAGLKDFIGQHQKGSKVEVVTVRAGDLNGRGNQVFTSIAYGAGPTEVAGAAGPVPLTVDQIMDLVYEHVAHDGHGSCTYRDLRAPLEAAMAPAEVTGGKNSADYDRRQMEQQINAILKRQTAAGGTLTVTEIDATVYRIAPGWEYATAPLANPPEIYLTIYSGSAPL